MADDLLFPGLFSQPRKYVLYRDIFFHEGLDPPVLDRITTGAYQLKDDDILVAGYPKSGATWATKILLLLLNPDKMDHCHQEPIEQLSGFLEFTPPGHPPLLDIMENMPSPRVIKTHLMPSFLDKQENVTNKKVKVVCVMRNPKDMLISYYHFSRMNKYLGRFTGSWSEFFEVFKAKQLVYGDWFDFVLQWWEYRHKYNILFLHYEDIHRDAVWSVRQIAEFVGKSVTEEQLQSILALSSFKRMQEVQPLRTMPGLDQKISPFMRKGEVGDWKNYFTPEENRYIDDIYRSKIFGSGLQFKFEI